jgi:hypothetical protein
MYVVQNFALVAGGFYATGRSKAIIVYHWKVKSYYCTVCHWKVNSNYCKPLEGTQQCLYTTGRSTAIIVNHALEGTQQCLYTTGRSTAIIVNHWKVHSNVYIPLEGEQQLL